MLVSVHAHTHLQARTSPCYPSTPKGLGSAVLWMVTVLFAFI